MSWVRLAGAFSTTPLVVMIERRFGLVGYARLVKLLELLALSPEPETGQVSMPQSDWLDALQAPSEEFYTLLNALVQANWLTFSQAAEPGGDLAVVFLQADSFLPEVVPVLLTSPEHWAFWCETELNMPRSTSQSAAAHAYFRRWCASNVTVTEMLTAIEQAAQSQTLSLNPSGLHSHLQAVRKARLEQARA